jgi:lipoyl-dependent peroxiredoxin subunit D
MYKQTLELSQTIPDFGRDIRLNLESLLSPEGSSGLSPRQIALVALSAGYALGTPALTNSLIEDTKTELNDADNNAAKAAATIMAMTNVYYRSTHLLEDPDFLKMPTRLRMNVIGKPGVDKADFELMCFAVSALAGCGKCLSSHMHELRKAKLSDEGIQSSLRLVSVLKAAQTALGITGT